ncbi:MAG: hypothetical protein V4576_01640 [Patescibacteria group bacterium]
MSRCQKTSPPGVNADEATEFFVTVQGGSFVYILVDSMQREDGSGSRYNITGRSTKRNLPPFVNLPFKGYCDFSKGGSGFLEFFPAVVKSTVTEASKNRISTPIQVAGGYYAAHSYQTFELRNLFEPSPMLGNGAYTTMFLRTESGNRYQIFRGSDFKWRILNGNSGHVKLLSQKDTEIRQITNGIPFSYSGGNTSTVIEIIAVNAGPVRIDNPPGKPSKIADGFDIRRTK